MTQPIPTTQSSRLPKTRRAPGLAPGLRLTERDQDIFYTLYHYRFLPAHALIGRHFGSMTRGRNRLKLLFHHGFLDRTFLPTAGPGVGEAIYSLGPQAVRELAVLHGLDPADIKRRRKPVEPHFVAHELEVARFRLNLGRLGAPHGVGLTDWRDRADASLRLPGGRLTPDGIGWVTSRRARFAFALEVDRGTMTVGRLRAKFDRYAEAARARALGGLLGADRFRVLVVVPSTRRLVHLDRAVRESGATGVWLTTEDALGEDFLMEPKWLRPGIAGHFPLLRREHIFDPIATPKRAPRPASAERQPPGGTK